MMPYRRWIGNILIYRTNINSSFLFLIKLLGTLYLKNAAVNSRIISLTRIFSSLRNTSGGKNFTITVTISLKCRYFKGINIEYDKSWAQVYQRRVNYSVLIEEPLRDTLRCCRYVQKPEKILQYVAIYVRHSARMSQIRIVK